MMTRYLIAVLAGAMLLRAQAAAPDVNPTVTPGLVHWHGDLAHAQAAAKSARRPVLLFQLLGELDRELC